LSTLAALVGTGADFGFYGVRAIYQFGYRLFDSTLPVYGYGGGSPSYRAGCRDNRRLYSHHAGGSFLRNDLWAMAADGDCANGETVASDAHSLVGDFFFHHAY